MIRPALPGSDQGALANEGLVGRGGIGVGELFRQVPLGEEFGVVALSDGEVRALALVDQLFVIDERLAAADDAQVSLALDLQREIGVPGAEIIPLVEIAEPLQERAAQPKLA